MRIYWYWPFAREEDIELARATPGPDDTLTVHALDRPGAPREDSERVTIRSELPDVADRSEGTARWALSRADTYRRRAALRRAELAPGRYDVAHVAFLNQYTDLVDLRRLARRIPIVTTVHDVVPHRTRLPAAVQHRLLAALYAACGTIIVHHHDVGTELVDRFGIASARVHVVPHWVSPFRAVDDRRTLHATPTVLCFGTLRRNKGIPELLVAIERIGPDAGIRFHIAGRGDEDLERAVLAAADRLPQLTAEITWITPERKTELLRTADLMVLPYTSFSSQSGVLHDAFGSHLPALVTDVGALRSSVTDAGAGWAVTPGSVDELTGALLGAFRDQDAWQRASDAARAVAVAQAPEQIGAAFRAVYRSAIAAAARTGSTTGDQTNSER
ncbi:MAG: glycosyltransferase family 4 protein [Acidimicrobiia bacterium]